MSRSALVRRVVALEMGPTSLKTFAGWAAVYGWAKIHEWDELGYRRIRTNLMPMPGDEPVPEETPLERQFHEAMAAAWPADPEAMEMLREKLLG